MDKSATGLKVMLAANTFTQSTIRVMYKLVPVGFVGNLDDLPFQFFNTTGIPDSGNLPHRTICLHLLIMSIQ